MLKTVKTVLLINYKCDVQVEEEINPQANWSRSAEVTGLSSLSLWAHWTPDSSGAGLSLL